MTIAATVGGAGHARYTYRLRVSSTALARLEGEWARCRWVWSECVAVSRKVHGLNRTATEKITCGPAQLDKAKLPMRQRAGMPRIKRKREAAPSLNCTRRGFRLRDGRLHLAGGIVLTPVWSRDLPAAPSSVRVYRDGLGHWYASFVVATCTACGAVSPRDKNSARVVPVRAGLNPAGGDLVRPAPCQGPGGVSQESPSFTRGRSRNRRP
ncbi:hypothetical protein Slala05_34990 [Streptomyces lavendulae subsp. lavendulae]|nr:hypothetical protein Slala05_34990 [Streptomyces lavendulae subsp. lavendulae]